MGLEKVRSTRKRVGLRSSSKLGEASVLVDVIVGDACRLVAVGAGLRVIHESVRRLRVQVEAYVPQALGTLSFFHGEATLHESAVKVTPGWRLTRTAEF